MASRRLPKHLRATLGSDAAEELMTILDEIRADRQRTEARFARIDERFNALERRMDERFTRLEVKIGDVKGDLMKWSFVFWCGAVASVAALAGVLR